MSNTTNVRLISFIYNIIHFLVNLAVGSGTGELLNNAGFNATFQEGQKQKCVPGSMYLNEFKSSAVVTADEVGYCN